MTTSDAWDRASALVVAAPAAVRTPELASLGDGLPALADLFTFMRDAEHRFSTLRMRIEERTGTVAGPELRIHDVTLRHPGEARILTRRGDAPAASGYDAWVTDGTTVRTYDAAHRVGTRRPVRRSVRGVDGTATDLPGASRVYLPRTPLRAESIPDLLVHPAGFLQNVLGTGTCRITGTVRAAGRDAIVVACDHPRTVERAADRPDHRIVVAVDRADGVILRLEESMGGGVTRDVAVTHYEPDAVLADSAFAFSFPPGTRFIY